MKAPTRLAACTLGLSLLAGACQHGGAASNAPGSDRASTALIRPLAGPTLPSTALIRPLASPTLPAPAPPTTDPAPDAWAPATAAHRATTAGPPTRPAPPTDAIAPAPTATLGPATAAPGSADGAGAVANWAVLPPRTEIPGVVHVWQKWNNCGPSSILMALSAFGVSLDQLDVAAQIKPDREDTNVTPGELAAFARKEGMDALERYGGGVDLVRRLVAAGVPVLAEQWIDVEGRGEMGHYRVVIGYDDDTRELIVQDSYYGARRRYAYDDFAAMWRPFLDRYVAVYRPDQAGAVAAAVGSDLDDAVLAARVLADHEAWAAAEPGNSWAWFTLGEARNLVGDHEGAVTAFERAIAIGLPTRAFWYQFGFYESLIATGRFARALDHADATIATMNGENLEESHYWRGRALEGLGRPDEAAESYRTALFYNPLYTPAAEALAALGLPPEGSPGEATQASGAAP